MKIFEKLGLICLGTLMVTGTLFTIAFTTWVMMALFNAL